MFDTSNMDDDIQLIRYHNPPTAGVLSEEQRTYLMDNHRWLHVNTCTMYVVVGFAQHAADQEIMVMYIEHAHLGKPNIIPMVRPYREFCDGRFVRMRYQPKETR